jgi:hypothetical protein
MIYSPVFEWARDIIYKFLPMLKYKPNTAIESRKILLALLITTDILVSLIVAVILVTIMEKHMNNMVLSAFGLCIMISGYLLTKVGKPKTPEHWNKWWQGQVAWWKV